MYVCDLCNLSNGKGKSTVGSFVLYASRHQGPAPQELPRGLNGLQTLLGTPPGRRFRSGKSSSSVPQRL